jgi:hypothetical protein
LPGYKFDPPGAISNGKGLPHFEVFEGFHRREWGMGFALIPNRGAADVVLQREVALLALKIRAPAEKWRGKDAVLTLWMLEVPGATEVILGAGAADRRPFAIAIIGSSSYPRARSSL